MNNVNRHSSLLHRIPHFLIGMIGIFMLCGCGEEHSDTSSGAALLDVTLQLSSSTSLSTVDWEYIAARTIGEDGSVISSSCNAYSPFTPPPSLKAPLETPFTAIIEIFRGVGVCEPNGGGILMARGASLPTTFMGDGLENTTIPVQLAPAGTFIETSSIPGGSTTTLNEARFASSATSLPNGQILVLGGAEIVPEPEDDGSGLPLWQQSQNLTQLKNSIELYDPATGLWTQLTEPTQVLPYPTAFHEAVYLPSQNLVAVIGGFIETSPGVLEPTGQIALLDLTTMTFLPAEQSGSSQFPRVFSTTTVLDYSGEETLLLVGGLGEEPSHRYEIIRPGPPGPSGTDHILASALTPSEEHARPRWNHTATLLTTPSGNRQVYLVGGEDAAGPIKLIDVFDVDGKRFFAPPEGTDAVTGLENHGRVGHQTTYVKSLGALYITGGYIDLDRTDISARIEVIDVETGSSLTSAQDQFNLENKRAHHRAVPLDDRRVLITGGITIGDNGEALQTSQDEVIGPIAIEENSGDDIVSAVSFAGMKTKRAHHHLIPLLNGQFLSFGGFGLEEGQPRHIEEANGESATSEIYTPIPLVNP